MSGAGMHIGVATTLEQRLRRRRGNASVPRFLLSAIVLLLAACGGGSSSSSVAPSPPGNGSAASGATVLTLRDERDAFLFLARGSFGAQPGEAASLVGDSASAWLQAEYRKPRTRYLAPLLNQLNAGRELPDRAHSNLFWDAAVAGNDQLRQRMVLALSQILVVSDRGVDDAPLSMAYYVDVLSQHAFGNYRDVLEAATYTPAMAQYLTYLRNRKGNPMTGRMPDENYAREIMQLFTIGLVVLNLNGTPDLNADGQPIETYTNDDVTGLAKVFTGFSVRGSEFFRDGAADDAMYNPLVVYPEWHSADEKSFLGTTIPAGTPARESVNRALDALVAHPNVGPFLGRQLIQRFVASDPAPQHIKAVAEAFDEGVFVAPDGTTFGGGVRGDLQATLAAVLLFEGLWDRNRLLPEVHRTKIREPVLQFTAWARAFNVSRVDAANERRLLDTSLEAAALGQHPFAAPSVFNFYRPGFVAPSTITGDAGRTAPEFQLYNEGTIANVDNFLTNYVVGNASKLDPGRDTYAPDYREPLALADEPILLVNFLSLALTGGALDREMRNHIADTVALIPVRASEAERDRRTRVDLAITMVTATPSFSILR